jgi:3-hydroxyisobutyrate dehydrogenase
VSSAEIQSVGFVGLGNMGWPMASNLVRAGFVLTAIDAVPGRASDFAATVGGAAAVDVRAVAARLDVLITMLPSSAEVSAVLLPVLESLKPDAIVIEMTSGVPSVTRSLAERLTLRRVHLIDCAVSGGVAKARTGELAIMAGGESEVIDRADPLLRALGSEVFRCGPVGAGHAMKALNNLVSAAGLLISIEALLIGQEAGLDPAIMVDVLNSSTGMNNSTKNKLKQFVLSRRFDSGFGLDLMVKDLSIALGVATEARIAAPMSELVEQLWTSAGAVLGPSHDHTEVAVFSERLADRRLVGPDRSQTPLTKSS